MIKKQDILFPHKRVREIQDKLIDDVLYAINNKKNLIANAPTGLGKTVATIAPALTYILNENKKINKQNKQNKGNRKVIFFITPRHSQHKIVIETLKKIREKHNINIVAVDLIGKKKMCPLIKESIEVKEFSEFCKSMKEKNLCEYHSNIIKDNKISADARYLIEMLKKEPHHVEDVIKKSKQKKLCPYEISLLLSSDADVVIADYFHLFDPSIRNIIFKRMDISIENTIIIIDEGHNLPSRINDLLTSRLTTNMLIRAVREAKKFGYIDMIPFIVAIQDVLNDLISELEKRNKEESLIEKEMFIDKLNERIKQIIKYNKETNIVNFDTLIETFEDVANEIRETKKQSYIGSISRFLSNWLGSDQGFIRIFSIKKMNGVTNASLMYKCIDPTILTKDVVNNTSTTILMSGTLVPTSMYSDLLGFDDEKTIEKTYESPFPKENKIPIIMVNSTTKYTKRSEDEYKKIAKTCSKISDNVDGNVAIFFPSYIVRDNVYRFINTNKKIFLEDKFMNKEQREELINQFIKNKKKGALLLAVIGGSFSEGIDLPGDELKAVAVVGIPLSKPNLETKSIIRYYDKKFGKGKEYAYIFPAMNKAMQAAGRCIRSEKDKGAVIFIDSRYAMSNYSRYMQMKNPHVIATDEKAVKLIKEFFS